MSWVVSVISLFVIYLMTKKWKYAPIFGLLGQFVWILYALIEKQYGLFPAIIGYSVVYILAIPKWMRDGN